MLLRLLNAMLLYKIIFTDSIKQLI